MDINQIIAAAETTANKWVNELTWPKGATQAILAFGTRKAADEVARQLRAAGATVSVTRTPYKEWIVTATWTA